MGWVGIPDGTVVVDPGVVDEPADSAVRAKALFDAVEIVRSGKVGRNAFDGHTRLRFEPVGERAQPVVATGDENEIMASLRQAIGIDRTDAFGRAGDEISRCRHGGTRDEGGGGVVAQGAAARAINMGTRRAIRNARGGRAAARSYCHNTKLQ